MLNDTCSGGRQFFYRHGNPFDHELTS